jgi:hypothetical protein
MTAQKARVDINENFVTVLIPNADDAVKWVEMELNDGQVVSVIDYDAMKVAYDEIYASLNEGESVKKDDRRLYLGAAKGVNAVITEKFYEKPDGTPLADGIYVRWNIMSSRLNSFIVLDITIDEIASVEIVEGLSNEIYYVTIHNVFGLHPDFKLTDRTECFIGTEDLNFYVMSSAISKYSYKGDPVYVGDRYLVAGIYDEMMHSVFTATRNENIQTIIREVYVNWLRAQYMEVPTETGVIDGSSPERFIATFGLDTDYAELWYKMLKRAEYQIAILPETGAIDASSPERFAATSGLMADEAEVWYNVIKNAEVSPSFLPVVTTENLDYIPMFNTKSAYIIDGRPINRKDHESKNKVCIISAELAEYNGLAVGDTITMALSNPHSVEKENQGSFRWYIIAPDVMYYEPTAEDTWEIVGIYHSTGWFVANMGQNYTPNTVFVSAGSLDPIPLTEIDELLLERYPDGFVPFPGSSMIYYSFLPPYLEGYYIENANVAGFIEGAGGGESRITVLDQGFCHADKIIKMLTENSQLILAAAAGLWIIVVTLFVFLHIARSRATVGTMRSLGFGKKKAAGMLIGVCLVIWLAAAAVAGAVSITVSDNLEEQVYKYTMNYDNYNWSFSDIASFDTAENNDMAEALFKEIYRPANKTETTAIALAVQFAAFAVACGGYVLIMVSRKPLKLIKG